MPQTLAAPPIARPAAPADLGAPRPADLTCSGWPDASGRCRFAPAVPHVPGRVLWALVLDGRGQPVAGCKVAARLEVAPSELSSGHLSSITDGTRTRCGAAGWELGFFPVRCPFPEDIIKGGLRARRRCAARRCGCHQVTATTSAQAGRGCFRFQAGACSYWSVTTIAARHRRGRGAASAPPMPKRAAALRIVLRLGAAADTLCAASGTGRADRLVVDRSGERRTGGRRARGRQPRISGEQRALSCERARADAGHLRWAQGALPRAAAGRGADDPGSPSGFAPLTFSQGDKAARRSAAKASAGRRRRRDGARR